MTFNHKVVNVLRPERKERRVDTRIRFCGLFSDLHGVPLNITYHIFRQNFW